MPLLYKYGMNNSPESETVLGDKHTHDEQPEAEDGSHSSPLDRDDVRIFLRKKIIAKLIDSGVPNDTHSLGIAVNDVLEYAVEATFGRPATLSDLLAIQEDLVLRIEELTAVNLGLAKVLDDLGTTIHCRQRYNRIRELANATIRRNEEKEKK